MKLGIYGRRGPRVDKEDETLSQLTLVNPEKKIPGETN